MYSELIGFIQLKAKKKRVLHMFVNIQVSMEDFLAGDSGVNALLPVAAEPKHEPEPAPTPLPRGRMEQTAKVL